MQKRFSPTCERCSESRIYAARKTPRRRAVGLDRQRRNPASPAAADRAARLRLRAGRWRGRRHSHLVGRSPQSRPAARPRCSVAGGPAQRISPGRRGVRRRWPPWVGSVERTADRVGQRVAMRPRSSVRILAISSSGTAWNAPRDSVRRRCRPLAKRVGPSQLLHMREVGCSCDLVCVGLFRNLNGPITPPELRPGTNVGRKHACPQ